MNRRDQEHRTPQGVVNATVEAMDTFTRAPGPGRLPVAERTRPRKIEVGGTPRDHERIEA